MPPTLNNLKCDFQPGLHDKTPSKHIIVQNEIYLNAIHGTFFQVFFASFT